MNITSLQPTAVTHTASSHVPVEEAAQRRQLLQAAQSVNASGVLGRNQLVFHLDRQTHRAVIRLVDPNTHQVISQIPPEYVLRLAQDLGSSTKVMMTDDDT
ncbi:MAG TPA: flagellar protein FlaG [Bryobacteraceae bacterium]|nr:flagellar protein FlaG [Bryobacteraceae bacterium]